jgi:hypothetical protein
MLGQTTSCPPLLLLLLALETEPPLVADTNVTFEGRMRLTCCGPTELQFVLARVMSYEYVSLERMFVRLSLTAIVTVPLLLQELESEETPALLALRSMTHWSPCAIEDTL